jgi:hypothetical protein
MEMVGLEGIDTYHRQDSNQKSSWKVTKLFLQAHTTGGKGQSKRLWTA